MTHDDVIAFESCIVDGGVALFPADTVYGLAAHPDSAEAVARLYRIKGRAEGKPAAVMFFQLERAFAGLEGIGPKTREALERILPGAVTVVVPNPSRRHLAACGPDAERIGVRVPVLEGAVAPLAAMTHPVLQSSANPAGESDPRRLEDVDPEIRAAVDVELDGGELPGTPSTVVDLMGYEEDGSFEVLRPGAVPESALRELL
jgi:L-threonylcarbamoyladenylate synthase